MALTAETNGCKYMCKITSSSPSKLSQVSNMRRAPLAFRNSHFDQHMRSMQGAYLNLLGTCKYIKIYSLRTHWMFLLPFLCSCWHCFSCWTLSVQQLELRVACGLATIWKKDSDPSHTLFPLKITKIQLKTEPENKRERQPVSSLVHVSSASFNWRFNCSFSFWSASA